MKLVADSKLTPRESGRPAPDRSVTIDGAIASKPGRCRFATPLTITRVDAAMRQRAAEP